MTAPSEDLVEQIARVIWDADPAHNRDPWSQIPVEWKAPFHKAARAVLPITQQTERLEKLEAALRALEAQAVQQNAMHGNPASPSMQAALDEARAALETR